MPRGDERDDEPIRLDDEEHAWWSQRDVTRPWTPPPPPEPEEDPLTHHLGNEWRFEFEYDPVPPGPPPFDDVQEPEDAYATLGVDPEAAWDDIVAAHRRQARLHHPDRLTEATEAERAAAEDRIRRINAAYRELKIRRGR